jgi:hypothetical protein
MIKYTLPIIFLLLLISCNPNDKPSYDIYSEYNFVIQNNKVRISGYFGKEKDVIIPTHIKNYPVVIIDKEAFESKGIQSVTLPEYLEIINDGAFAQNQLTSITFPDNVSYIGRYAFARNKLKNVSIPKRITHINPETFCFNELTSVNFHNNIQRIENLAFQQNYLTDILLPDSLTYIGPCAFEYNKITSLAIPKNISEIENYTFFNNLISVLIIPDNIKKIGEYAFYNCASLTSVTFEGTIPSDDFSFNEPFPGDLRDKFYADDADNGTPGRYTREINSTIWIRQP